MNFVRVLLDGYRTSIGLFGFMHSQVKIPFVVFLLGLVSII